MSEDTQVSQEQPVVNDAPKTLDDVISEFNVTPQVEEQPNAPNNVAEFTPPQPQHIDPYDENSLNKWALDTAQHQSALQQQVQELNAKLTQQEQARAQAIVDADIKSAVSKITESVDGIDPLMAELYLNKRAEEKPEFKAIWDNRHKNPAAFEAALGAISTELDGKFQRIDPQLAENHRAAQQSTQSNNAPAASDFNNSYEERLAGAKNEQERALIWSQIKNGG